jgi:hypothetical protein
VDNKWGWREEKVQLDDDDLVDIAQVEESCKICVTGFWITDANVDSTTLKKSEMQRRREQVYVQPGREQEYLQPVQCLNYYRCKP